MAGTKPGAWGSRTGAGGRGGRAGAGGATGSGGMGLGSWAAVVAAAVVRAIRNAMLKGRSMEDSLLLAVLERWPEQKNSIL